MKVSRRACGSRLLRFAVATVMFSLAGAGTAEAGEYLVGDRILGRVLRFSENGTFIAELLNDPTLGVGSGPTQGGMGGITLSPDQTKLFITNRVSNQIHVYDYNGISATPAAQPLITAISAAPSTIFIPASTMFSADGNTLYVSNLGSDMIGFPNSTQVAQLKASDYTSAGADLTGGPATGRSGLALAPDGDVLVSTVGFFSTGGVLRFDGGANPPATLVTPIPELSTAGGLLVVGDDLYVASGGGNRVGKFDVNTGAIDTSVDGDGYVTNLPFAASLALGPNGDTILVGVLGATNGASRIDEFDFNGNLVGGVSWATNTHALNHPNGTNMAPGSSFGFSEPTGIVFTTVIPEPATTTLLGLAVVGFGLVRGRSRRRTN